MTLLSNAVQYALSGITVGSIYAIVGICWSTVFLISGVLNFSTGEFAMLGGMLTWAYANAGISLGLAAGLSVITSILIAALLERVVINPVRYPTETTYMLITIAAASVIKGIILLTCGTDARRIRPFLEVEPISILGATLIPQVLVVLVVLMAVTLFLWFFFNHTLFGKALRASSINPIGASLIGIEISRFRLFCFALAGGLGAISGIIFAPISFTGYNLGFMVGVKGLVVAIVGGWTIAGTVAAGLALGLVEGFAAGFISTGWKDAIALFAMIVFLVLQTVDFSGTFRRRQP
jgi:branched-chain amino acid transport system permease protein